MKFRLISVCLVLLINLIFLIRIMFVSISIKLPRTNRLNVDFLSPSFSQVLITKLRSANTVETRQYRKASKALLVLIPLLGITYLIVLLGPDEGLESHIFAYLRAISLSSQVGRSLHYCHTNLSRKFPRSGLFRRALLLLFQLGSATSA